MVAGLLSISWLKLFSIAQELNVLFYSGSILLLKRVGYEWGFDLEDSFCPVWIWRALRLPFLLWACIFLIALSFFSTSQLLLPVMCPSPQFTHLDSLGHCFVLSLVWSSSPQFRQTAYRRHLVFVSVFVALVTYHGPVLILVCSGIWWLSGVIESVWLFFQVEGKEYCRGVRVLGLDETCFYCIFDDWVRFFQGSLNSSLNSQFCR